MSPSENGNGDLPAVEAAEAPAEVTAAAAELQPQVEAEPAPHAAPPEPASKPETPVRVNPRVTADPEKPPIEQITPKHRSTVPVAIIPRSLKDFGVVNAIMENAIEELTTTPTGQEWLVRVYEGQRHYAAGGLYVGATQRPDSDWGQVVEYNGGRLTAGVPPLGGGGQKLVGNKAALAMRAGMGLASAISFPLWHSGIWLNTTAPMDTEVLIFLQQLMQEKIDLGNMTQGLLFSSNGVFAAMKLYDFVMSKVYSQTVENPDPEELKKLIKVTDLPLMAWGMALTIYPHGFTHSIPCIADISKCNHVGEYHLNLARLLWVDRSALTAEQKRHMSVRKAAYTVDEVKRYQSHGPIAKEKVVQLNSRVSVKFFIPSLHDWFEAGKRWINSIEEAVEKGFGTSLSTKQKNDHFAQQAVLTVIRQYSAWVKSVTYDDVEYDDIASIDQMLSALSEDGESTTKFYNEIKDFVDEVAIAIVAVPTFNCPVCESPMTPEEALHPEIYPLDPLQVFFTLADHRTLRAKVDSTSN